MIQRSSLASRICGTAALVLLTCCAARLHAAAPATTASRTDISAAACTPAEERGQDNGRAGQDNGRASPETGNAGKDHGRAAPNNRSANPDGGSAAQNGAVGRPEQTRPASRPAGPFAAHVLRQRRVHGDPLHDLPPREFFRFAERGTGDHRGIQLDVAPGCGRRRRLFGRVHLGPTRRFRTHQPHSLHRPRIRRAAARRTQVALPRKRGYRLRPLHPQLRPVPSAATPA
ncbi:uncharacterized protein BN754_02231 [Alistipes finegoldii CAG:68]|nr:uncharacterized protein BN754_02231 [Alistipes finegoldii CAG:68]